MASALHLANQGVRHHDLGMGLLGAGISAGFEFGSGFGINYLRCKNRDKAWGQKMPLIAAVAGKLAMVGTSLAGHRLGGGKGQAVRIVAGAFDSVGGAGLALMGAEYGARFGNKAAGVQAVVLPATAALPAGARSVSMGELGGSPDGEAFSWPQLMALRQMP